MARFQVPQFVEVEDKIFGPLTFRQFIYLAGGAGLSFVLYSLLPLLIAAPLILVVVAFSLALAFYKVNSKPFIEVVESAFRYVVGGKLYIWRKETKKPQAKEEKTGSEKTPIEGLSVPKVAQSKLRDIAWSLDVQESIYSAGESPAARQTPTTQEPPRQE